MYGSPIRMRKLNLQFESLEKDEFFLELFGPLVQEKGTYTEVLVSLSGTDRTMIPYQSVYGNLANAEEAAHAFWNHLGIDLQIEESV
jgi:hypothetical protein